MKFACNKRKLIIVSLLTVINPSENSNDKNIQYIQPSCKHVRVMNTPLHPTLYSKNGVYRGIDFFLFLLLSIGCMYSLEPPK